MNTARTSSLRRIAPLLRTALKLSVIVVAATLVLLGEGRPGRAANPYCYTELDRTTYDNGFSASDFSESTDVSVSNGELKLVTDDKKLGDTNRISIRTRQELKIYYLYESAGGSHTLGWFLWDDNIKKYVAPNGYNYTSTTCSTADDCDPGMQCLPYGGMKYCAYDAYKLRDDGSAGGIGFNQTYDWFEDLYQSNCSSCRPYLLSGSHSYADGGSYDHIPNLLESLVAQGGGWIFLLCDDDKDTNVGGGWPRLPPVDDSSSSFNGIPDYDVDGQNGITLDDRMVELGTFDGGTEMVFFHIMYYGQSMRRHSAGMSGYGFWDYISSRIIPFFSKRVLNPDYRNWGNYSVDRDIGCGYPHSCGNHQGWLDSDTLNRLQNDFGITMPHEVKTIYVRQDGQMEHMFLGAPSTDPTWWLLGFEDLYDGGDNDYNDIVFLVWRTNGGEVVSNMVATEIPPNKLDDTTITKVRIRKQDNIPTPPCSTDPEHARIEYYISVSEDQNGKPIWILVEFPANSDEVTLDLQEMGYTGSKLRWKAVIISDNHKCQPTVEDVDIGYEALQHGEYVFTSPLPLANVLYRGAVETPDNDWQVTGNDRSNRGHFKLYEVYSPDNPENETMQLIWDAGARLTNKHPDDRDIITNKDGSAVEVKQHGSNWLLQEVLPTADRIKKHNGKFVYDLDEDGDSDDDDARHIVQWTRGWEIPNVQQRAWKLGAINASTAAIAHVPGEPAWLDGSGIDGSIKTEYRAWANDPARAERRTVAVVGGQDGMLHGFDAGEFRWGDNPQTTSIVEQRGYFQFSGAQPEYGSGDEFWAYIPESLLHRLKNNLVRDYYPEDNPFAMVDGSVAVSDVYVANTWKTAVFFSMGRNHPYISALEVTQPKNPAPLWTTDWTDADFQGTKTPPTVAWVDRGSAGPEGKTWMVSVTSGLAKTPGDVFLYLIDAENGQTMTNGKVQLNVGGGLRADQSYGVSGRPVLIDFDGNGFTDRIYVADTNGRIWKHEPDRNPGNSCLVAAVGEPIYVTPTVSIRQNQVNGDNVVTLYFGTGDSPEANDTANPPYHFFAFADRDGAGQCSLAEQLYEYELPPDEKVWADAAVAADQVYVGTSTGAKAHICDEDPSNPGHIYVFDINPGPSGEAMELANPVAAGGSVVSGVMVYDQHVFANTLGGKTKIIGGSTWNNLASMSDANGLRDIYWQEVINGR
jgi:hypothetical protein